MDPTLPFDPLSATPPSSNGGGPSTPNGSVPPHDPAGPDEFSEPQEETGVWRYARRDRDRETTRYLAAATQLDVRYANKVVHQIVDEPFRALAPAYGADISVVARWAVDSVLRRARRDKYLATLLVLGIIVGWTCRSSFPAILIVAGVTLAIAWSIVALEHWTRVYRIVAGQMLREKFNPDEAPEPPYRWITERIEAIAQRRRGNLVVFQRNPAFVGSGQRLSSEQIVIDVSRGRKVKDGKLQKPRKFTNADVHAALIAAMKKLKFEDMHVEERLFVNGHHIKGNKAFLPRGAAAPPAPSVEPRLLRQAVLCPTPDARAYVCVEMPGWQGQLVVTLFARAVHAGGSLYIEWAYYVLPPIDKNFMNIDQRHNKSAGKQLWLAYLWASRKVLLAFMRAPFVLASDLWRAVISKRQVAKQAYAIKRGREYNYGASQSIREAASDGSRHHFFLERDEIMYLLVSQQALVNEIRDFLRKHDVGVGAYNAQVTEITKSTFNYYNVHFGEVSDSVVAVGDKSTAKGSSPKSK